jgi:uncharacterized protein YjbK
MNKNIELEFKTVIPKESYENILLEYNLNDNVFLQTNHYFDTPELTLSDQHIVLRIRQKGKRFFKVTLKSQHPEDAYESHILLSKEQAKTMLKNGFHTKDFFPKLDVFVTYITSIDNYRASLPYHHGIMFVDRCEYCGQIDYELEYEVPDYEEGLKQFELFLSDHALSYVKTKRKSERAFSCNV